MTFTDPTAAIEQADFLAAVSGCDFAIVLTPDGLLRVAPLRTAGGGEVLEVCRP